MPSPLSMLGRSYLSFYRRCVYMHRHRYQYESFCLLYYFMTLYRCLLDYKGNAAGKLCSSL